MKIKYIGHSCFKIEKNGCSFVTDPYEDGYVPGLSAVKEEAGFVLCSHEHRDHGASEVVTLVKEEKEAAVLQIPGWHDDVKGTRRGPNTMFVVEMEGERIAHLGDIGCELEEDQLEKIKGVDVLLIPIGGFYTVGPKEAAEIARKIEPGIVIPMHYRDDEKGFGYDIICPVEEFEKVWEPVLRTGGSEIDTESLTAEKGTAVILTPANSVK